MGMLAAMEIHHLVVFDCPIRPGSVPMIAGEEDREGTTAATLTRAVCCLQVQ